MMQGRSTLGGSTKRHQVSWDIRSATHEVVEELDDELDHTYVFSHIYVFFPHKLYLVIQYSNAKSPF